MVVVPGIIGYSSGGTPDMHVCVEVSSGNYWGDDVCGPIYAAVIKIPCFLHYLRFNIIKAASIDLTLPNCTRFGFP